MTIETQRMLIVTSETPDPADLALGQMILRAQGQYDQSDLTAETVGRNAARDLGYRGPRYWCVLALGACAVVVLVAAIAVAVALWLRRADHYPIVDPLDIELVCRRLLARAGAVAGVLLLAMLRVARVRLLPRITVRRAVLVEGEREALVTP